MMVQIVQVREVEGVKVEGLVEKRIVRRAQEAMKPLFFGTKRGGLALGVVFMWEKEGLEGGLT